MSHNFNRSLIAGQQAEALFAASFPHLKRLSGYQSDFVNPRTGATYELKADRRTTIQTPNIFIEILSNKVKGTPGGPAQALKNGTDFWVYLFADQVAFIFNTKRLAAWVRTNEDKYRHINIANQDWTTTGIIVKRTDVGHLAKKLLLPKAKKSILSI
jgi:hypothetical protein